MTWFANHIFALPSDGLLKYLSNHPELSRNIYWVKDISNHNWYDAATKHDLPKDGFVVIRPVGDPNGVYASWDTDEQPLISWDEFLEKVPIELEILPAHIYQDQLDFNSSDYPPVSFLQHLKFLSQTAKTTIAYYHCAMWGGDVELEYSWVFDTSETMYSFISFNKEKPRLAEYCSNKPKVEKIGDVLVETMKHFDVNLPTPYFALHTRTFPWHIHKFKANGWQAKLLTC